MKLSKLNFLKGITARAIILTTSAFIVGSLIGTQVTSCNLKKEYKQEKEIITSELTEVNKDLALCTFTGQAYKDLATQKQVTLDSLEESIVDIKTEKDYCELTLRKLRTSLKECEKNNTSLPLQYGNSNKVSIPNVVEYTLLDTVYLPIPALVEERDSLRKSLEFLNKELLKVRIARLEENDVNTYQVESYLDSTLLYYQTFTPISLEVKKEKKKGFLKFGHTYTPVLNAPKENIFKLEDPYQLFFKNEERLLLKSENVNEYLQRIMH